MFAKVPGSLCRAHCGSPQYVQSLLVNTPTTSRTENKLLCAQLLQSWTVNGTIHPPNHNHRTQPLECMDCKASSSRRHRRRGRQRRYGCGWFLKCIRYAHVASEFIMRMHVLRTQKC